MNEAVGSPMMVQYFADVLLGCVECVQAQARMNLQRDNTLVEW